MPDDQTSNPSRVGPYGIPRGVWLLLAAKVLITTATVGQLTILGKEVWDMTGDELSLGLLGLAEFVPTAVLSPITGSVADRYDRRIIAGAGLLASALVSFALWAYVSISPTSVAPIYALIVIFGASRAFIAPAIRALPVDLSPRDTVERVVALSSLSWQIGSIVGPVAAGFLFVANPSSPYLLSGILLLMAVVALATIGSSSVERLEASPGLKATLSDALDGLRFIRATPVLFGAISLDLFAVLFGGAVALLPAIAEDRLGVGAIGLGWLRASIGIGAGVVALGLSIRPLRRHVGHVLLTMVGVFGLATLVLGITRSYTVAFAALFVMSAADAFSVFIRSAIVPLATPPNMRGRVLATENVFIGASNELGAFESGVTGRLFGLVGAIMIGGFGTLAVVVLWAVFFPKLRQIDRFDELDPTKASSH